MFISGVKIFVVVNALVVCKHMSQLAVHKINSVSIYGHGYCCIYVCLGDTKVAIANASAFYKYGFKSVKRVYLLGVMFEKV